MRSPAALIRHGQSTQNKAGHNLDKLSDQTENGLDVETWLTVYGDPTFIDSRLSDEGIQQCLSASEHSKKHDFVILFISPLRRTLETAYYI